MGPLETMTDACPKAWHALRVPSILSLPRTPAMRRARSQPGKDGRGLFCEPPSPPTSNVLRYFIHLLSCQSKIPTYSRLREFVWVVASPPRWHGPQVRALWHHGGHEPLDVVGPMAPPGRASGRGCAGVYTDRRRWPLGATAARMQNAVFRGVVRPECGFPWRRPPRMRLSVTSRWRRRRRVRFSVRRRVQSALLREAVCAECAFA